MSGPIPSLVDQTVDVGCHDLYRLAHLYDAVPFFKAASQEELVGEPALPARVFADPSGRRFPCHTKAATILSWLHFLDQEDRLPPKQASRLRESLSKFANYWSVSQSFEEMEEKRAAMNADLTAELPDSSFALVRTYEDGQVERRYPLRNGKEVQAAAGWFVQHRDHFGFDDRREMASRILQKAAEFKTSLEEKWVLERQAARGWCRAKQAADLLRSRAYIPQLSREAKDGLRKAAAEIENQPQIVIDNTKMRKIAEQIDNLDRLHRVRYTELMPRVEDALFGVTYSDLQSLKQAACRTVTGTYYDKEQFAKLALSAVRGAFGDELAGAVADGLNVDPEKMAEIAATFPRNDARVLDEIMAEAGETPLGKEAVSLRPRLTMDHLQKLAALRQ